MSNIEKTDLKNQDSLIEQIEALQRINQKNQKAIQEASDIISYFSKEVNMLQRAKLLNQQIIYTRELEITKLQTAIKERDLALKDFKHAVQEVEKLQKINVENQKIIREYSNKINWLVKEVEKLQEINLENERLQGKKKSRISKMHN